MVFQIVWSRTALRELRAIGEYIAAENPTAAEGVVRAIKGRVDVLQTLPFGFPTYGPSLDENTRHTVVGRYRIFYRVEPDKHRVRVLKLWHSSRQEPDL